MGNNQLYIIAALVGLITLGLVVLSKAPNQEPISAADNLPTMTRAEFNERMDYLVRDGGQWLAENPNYTAGDGSPVSFGYQFEWGPNRAYVEIEIFGRAEYDTHQSYWKLLSAWHPESRRAEHFQVGAGGAVGTGIAYYPSETHEEILIEFVNPDGSRMYLKDVSETIDEDHFVSTSYLRSSPDEEWRESQVLNWERVRG